MEIHESEHLRHVMLVTDNDEALIREYDWLVMRTAFEIKHKSPGAFNLIDWLDEVASGGYHFRYADLILFENKEDAIAFKMRWG